MAGFEIGILSVLAIILLIYGGMHVAVVLAATSFVGVWLIRGNFEVASRMLGLAAGETISAYIFGVVPLFVLMGLYVSVAGVGLDTFTAANRIFGKIRGGVGIATVAANAIFAAVTGISIASAAVFTKIAVPEMLRLGYNKRYAVGIVAGSSILGMLIPPSLLLIVYAVLSELSVADMFLAGIIPGTIMSITFSIGIVLMAIKNPEYAGSKKIKSDVNKITWNEAIKKIIPISVLILIVMGGIYGGYFTPTEAGATGALASFVIALGRKKLNAKGIWRVLSETGLVTASICLLIIGAGMYSRMLTLSGVPEMVGDWFASSGLGYVATISVYVFIIIIMGTFMDAISIMLIMVPLALPVFSQFGVDQIWLGVVTVVAVEIGIITPPLGIGVFVIKGSLARQDITLGDIFRGAFPFVIMMTLVLIMLILFPGLSTVLI